jgi:predicted Zn-dependent protease
VSIVARVLLTIATVAALVACESTPITGRTRLAPEEDPDLNARIAFLYSRQMARQALPATAEPSVVVRRVGARIAQIVENPPGGLWKAPGYDWEFNVINKPGVNAYCMPGGKVAVTVDMMALVQGEDALAIVMGHEVAHALLLHHGERKADEKAVMIGSTIFGAILVGLANARNPGSANTRVAQDVFDSGQLLLLSFGRTQESEADRVGMIMAARAGYDPRAAIGFWERMKVITGKQTPEYLSTHPSHDTRIADIKKYLPEALQHYKPAP